MQEPNPNCAPYSEDLELLLGIVREAGLIAKTAFEANDAKVWDKEKNHPVTDADIEVNDFLEEKLRSARPDYGWLSEETKDDNSRHACPRSFVVDPIDGTRAFIDRTPNFVVSVAIIEQGRSIAGVVYNPLKGALYSAFLGGGAQLNGKAIQAADSQTIEGIHMVGYARKFRKLKWPRMNCRIVNSMAYRIVLAASGEDDATVAFTPKSDWDVAAAQLIAAEAGAVITNLRGQALSYDGESTKAFGIICAGPKLHALLVKRIRPVIAQFEKSGDKPKDFGFMGTTMTDHKDIQLLHLVIGGDLVDPNRTEFKDLNDVDFVGAYPNYDLAYKAWKSAAQRTVDNAHSRYFILHAHELIDPDKDGIIG